MSKNRLENLYPGIAEEMIAYKCATQRLRTVMYAKAMYRLKELEIMARNAVNIKDDERE